MKKEIKDIIFVGIVSLFLVIGLILSAELVASNVFTNGNNVTIEINYSNRSYKYKIKTKKENLYEVLSSNNKKLALGLYVSGDEEKYISSLKSTESNSLDNYVIYINDIKMEDDIAGIAVTDGDVVTIKYCSNFPPAVLVEGGDSRISDYEKISIALYTISVIIMLMVIVYICVALVRHKRDKTQATI